MNDTVLTQLITDLSAFVTRATKEGATQAEVEALPGIARVLADILT